VIAVNLTNFKGASRKPEGLIKDYFDFIKEVKEVPPSKHANGSQLGERQDSQKSTHSPASHTFGAQRANEQIDHFTGFDYTGYERK
jgi:hypothetical protein